VSERRDLWREEFRPCIGHEIELFEDAIRNRTSTPTSALGQLLDYNAYLPEDVLRKVDVASMAHGLEVRTPLVDVQLVELITQIPSEFTVAAYDGSLWRSKPLLRDLLLRWLDPEFVNRPKQGFELPIRQWLSAGGELRSWAERLVLSDGSLIHGFLRREAIARIFGELDAGRGHASKVWQLVCLEKWMRHSKGVVH
jgi:asparagine synthase (glutamine-hydrolysing)